MPQGEYNVLFLSHRNSARSIFAEAVRAVTRPREPRNEPTRDRNWEWITCSRALRSWCRLKQWYKHHLRPGLRGVSTAQRIVQLTKASGFHQRKGLLRHGREGI